ncbi:MAG: universal stress protein [Deltaproteobacteria bacterium]|jgi:nucleotide-binding universal stress UspA family protein|nr:universal stress protein [Deltaproteobacteria bacterium]
MLESRRILVPIDFSASTPRTLAYAAEFARAFGVRLDVLHVCALHEESVGEAQREMDTAIPDDLNDVVERRHIVRALSADLGIIHEARERAAGLIIMGTHGRSGLRHVLLGSIAERVVQLAGCPVLTVRQPDHRFERP